jgi:dihydrofolate reductase
MKLYVFNHLTLDGVMQSPGGPEEDRRGGFKHGGWAQPDNDDVMNEAIGRSMQHSGSLLLGRFTYQAFYDYWPKQKNNPFTDVLNNTQKYVVSRTLKEPLPWQNSTLLGGDATESVAKLKQQPGKGLTVLGSGELCQALMRANLVDEYLLMIHPRVLGSGKRLFPDGGAMAALEVVDSKTTTKGVVIATYRPRQL